MGDIAMLSEDAAPDARLPLGLEQESRLGAAT
jgi:hypothetical protein